VIHRRSVDAVLIVACLAGAGPFGPWPTLIAWAPSAAPPSPSATGGSSWSCVHSPLKAAGPGPRPAAMLQDSTISEFPVLVAADPPSAGENRFSSRGPAPPKSHLSAINPRMRWRSMDHSALRTAHQAGRNRKETLLLLTQTRTARKLNSACRLSVSVIGVRRVAGKPPGAREACAGTRPMRTT
jgi:hypothetical protein